MQGSYIDSVIAVTRGKRKQESSLKSENSSFNITIIH